MQILGLDAEWYNTADGDYFRYVRQTIDAYLDAHPDGANEKQPDDPMRDALLGEAALQLYRVTLKSRYYDAASHLRGQLAPLCGIASESRGPAQKSGDASTSVCVAAPFLAEYASVFQSPQDFAAITNSILKWDIAIHSKSSGRDGFTTKNESYLAMALVDALPYYPHDDAGREQLVAVLNRIADGIDKHHDAVPGSPESACLAIYAIFKGVRLGYLPPQLAKSAERAWSSFEKDFVQDTADGSVALRNPSTIGQEHSSSSPGIGALLLASTEADHASASTLARGQTVMLDAWYNSQQRKNPAGQMESFHYKWSDQSDSGYSLLRHMFQSYGAATDTLYSAPTRDKLSKAQFYIIVSPDIPVKNPNPHYMTDPDAAEIASWVHEGGVLILMENDPPNADISHLNLLADRFGIHFDDVLIHHIIGEQVADGTIPVNPGGPLFHQPHTLYMKDTCAISVHGAAMALLRDRGAIVMATAKYGRGTVFAAVDPWVYNEYTDGRRNPQIYGQFDNFAGGKELVLWLLEQHAGADSDTRKSAEK